MKKSTNKLILNNSNRKVIKKKQKVHIIYIYIYAFYTQPNTVSDFY